jgi:3-(3-hydroxy-phenyl)propionate hydroxylase
VVAEFDLANMRDVFRFPFVLQYEQYKLTAAIAAKYAMTADFDVRFSHRVAAIEQRADGVDVEVVSPHGREWHRASYLIGCDGGRSTVRKHAGIEFEGFTYCEKFSKIGAPQCLRGEMHSSLNLLRSRRSAGTCGVPRCWKAWKRRRR